MAAVLDLVTENLARIEARISTLSTKMVGDAWEVGALLNEAREALGNDNDFGAWRAEKIEPLGISDRTARRMAALARTYPTREALPKGVNLSVLYMLTSPSTGDRELAALTAALEKKPDLPVREAMLTVATARNAVRRERKDDDTPARFVPPPLPKAEPEDEGVDPHYAWAEGVVKGLAAKGDRVRMSRLNALLFHLKKRGLLVSLDEEVSISATAKGRIEVTR